MREKPTPEPVDLESTLAPDAHAEIRVLAKYYDEGVLTYRELVNHLMDLGRQLPPATVAQGLPATIIEHLRAAAEHIPDRPEQLFKLPTWEMSQGEREAAERYRCEMHAALLRWHRHFWQL